MKYQLQVIKLEKVLNLTFINKKHNLIKNLVFTDTHLNFNKALFYLKTILTNYDYVNKGKILQEDYDYFHNLHDTIPLLTTWSNGELSLSSTSVIYKGKVLNDALSSFLIDKFIKNPHNTNEFEIWCKFIKSVEESNSNHVTERLFLFLSHNDLYLAEDGSHVLAWKVVNTNYFDKYTNTIDNSVGQTITVNPNQVEADPNKACSKGLHIASLAYLNTCYANYGDRLMVVKVPIKNIISIPYDYKNGSKVRTCGYTVIADAGAWGQDVDINNYPDLSIYGGLKGDKSLID